VRGGGLGCAVLLELLRLYVSVLDPIDKSFAYLHASGQWGRCTHVVSVLGCTGGICAAVHRWPWLGCAAVATLVHVLG
jgi:hypothetical protein